MSAISREELKRILSAGRNLPDAEYHQHSCIYMKKTFYFFCKGLIVEPPGAMVSSTMLNSYIVGQLELSLTVKPNFNPHGFFGKGWTDWKHGEKTRFQSEYASVLTRSESEPYCYGIEPKYFEFVKSIFEEFEAEQPTDYRQGNLLMIPRRANA